MSQNSNDNAYKKFSLFDTDGSTTGYNLREGNTLKHLIISLALFVICLFLPLDFISPMASRALALTVLVLYMWITLYVDLVISSLVLAIGAVVLGLVTYGEVATTFGTSQFLPMFGVCIVALGITNTKLTTRFAYYLLWKLGKKPVLIGFAAVIVTAVLSSTVSNIATAILVAAAFAPVIKEVGNEKLGKAIMILIPIASMYGGAALPNGAGPNLVAMGALESITQGEYVVSYGQWATVGWTGLTILIPIMVLLYIKFFGVSNEKLDFDTEKIKHKLEELGPLTGPEVRWLLLVLTMIGLLLAGFPMGTVGIGIGILCLIPGVGILTTKQMLDNTPWFLLFILGFSPILATILTSSGLADVMLNWLIPYLSNLGPFALILAFTLLKTIMNNIIISGPAPVSIIIITGFAPVLMSMGYNPASILLASMLIAHPATILGSVPTLQTTFQYGYWKINDPVIPGTIMAILAAVVVSTVTYFLNPMIGLNFYL